MQPPDPFALSGYFTTPSLADVECETAVLTSASFIAFYNTRQPNMAMYALRVNGAIHMPPLSSAHVRRVQAYSSARLPSSV